MNARSSAHEVIGARGPVAWPIGVRGVAGAGLRHVHQEHGGINQPLKLEVIAPCPGDSLLRQITEAVEITETNPILNSKVEWDTRNKPRKRKYQNRN